MPTNSVNNLKLKIGLAEWLMDVVDAWNRFWFTPASCSTMSLMRIATGCIVVYTLLVWTIELTTFLHADGLLPSDYRRELAGGGYAWSHFDWHDSLAWVWGSHVFCVLTAACWTVGLWTRWTGVLTAAIVISYANRATGALFGLDQILGFLTLYLALSCCGDRWSVDPWLRSRSQGKAGQGGGVRLSVWNRIATRLIQLHLCLVYLFAAIGKLAGETWLNGEAVWGAFASYEYQTLDMTWLSGHMTIVAVMTLVSLFWELSYSALIWPRLTRPVMLVLAVMMHTGIGVAMGMMTFGLIMIVANMAFIEPQWLERETTSL